MSKFLACDSDTEEYFPDKETKEERAWREEKQTLVFAGFVFFVLLLGTFWWIHQFNLLKEDQKDYCAPDAVPYRIQTGDTCQKIGDTRGISVDDILRANPAPLCEHLCKGRYICVPK